MNDHDLANVRFLLSRTPEQLHEWYSSVNEVDLLYAAEILERYGEYLVNETKTIEIENQLSNMTTFFEAQAVIAAIRD